MKKGYIFKNDKKKWELGFVSNIDDNGDALYTTHDEYSTRPEAFAALVKVQIEGQ